MADDDLSALLRFIAERLDEEETDLAPWIGETEFARRMQMQWQAHRSILISCKETLVQDPGGRVLAETVLRHLAAMFQDHPDHRTAWLPY